MGNFLLSSDLTSTAATVWSHAERYILNGSRGISLVRIGGFVKNSLRTRNPDLHSSLQVNLRVLEASFIAWKKGRHIFEACGINCQRAAMHPVSFWTSLIDVGSRMLWISIIWLGSTSIPRWEIKNPRNFPEVNPKEHFAGFNRMRWRLTFLKVSRKFVTWSWVVFDFVIMSST